MPATAPQEEEVGSWASWGRTKPAQDLAPTTPGLRARACAASASRLRAFARPGGRSASGDNRMDGDDLPTALVCPCRQHPTRRSCREGRLRCGACRHEVLVPFSCKRRGIFPSCTVRRAEDTAAHLVDHVLARVPYRQWVFTFPIPVRLALSRRPHLVTAALQSCLRVLCSWQRRRLRRRPPATTCDHLRPPATTDDHLPPPTATAARCM